MLLLNLLGKLDCEEKLLLERVPDYATYRQRTKRLIPFVLGIGILFADQCAITTLEPSQLRPQGKDRREYGRSQPGLAVGAIVFLAG